MNDDKIVETCAILSRAFQDISDIWSKTTAPDLVKQAPMFAPKPPETIYIYVFGCKGLSQIAQRNGGRSLYKIGTTTYRDINDRLHEIAVERYAAAVKVGNQFIVESGFENWISLMIRTSRQPRHADMTLLPRAIKVCLPSTLTRREFDQALHRKLSHLSVNAEASELCRYTLSLEGEKVATRRAREIYFFAPLKDGDSLLEAVEAILVESVIKKTKPDSLIMQRLSQEKSKTVSKKTKAS